MQEDSGDAGVARGVEEAEGSTRGKEQGKEEKPAPLPGDVMRHAPMMLSTPESRYIGIFQVQLPDEDLGRLNDRAGFVLYASVDSRNVGAAWDAVVQLIVSHHVTLALVVKQDAELPEEHRGRQIVLYDFLSPKEWERAKFLNAAEKALMAAGVEPGEAPRNTQPIKGSRCWHYHDNQNEVIAERAQLAARDPARDKTENFSSPYMTSEFDLPASVEPVAALRLIRANQIFYEIDRRLPKKFGTKLTSNAEGNHVEFDGNIMLAMKITDSALSGLLPKRGP
jgi:hypothetical protein